MHILDDLTGLSTRAKSLLERTGWREHPHEPRIPTEFLRIHDRTGRPVPTPMMLVIRREGFDQRYGGLRYRVRDTYTIDGERHEIVRDWHYDLGQAMWTDHTRGWYFDWLGERVSTPVRYLVHTDGRVGVDDGNAVFLEIAPSIPALIESHALADMVATWDRILLEVDGFALACQFDGLIEVPEASGPTLRWRVSDNIAVQEFKHWSSETPRRWRAFIWSRGEAGRLQVKKAAAAASDPAGDLPDGRRCRRRLARGGDAAPGPEVLADGGACPR